MRPTAPFRLLFMTMVCVVLVNVVVAQVILHLAYPSSAWKLSWSAIAFVTIMMGFAIGDAVKGWRAYLRLVKSRRKA
jgi:hypothetical protein